MEIFSFFAAVLAVEGCRAQAGLCSLICLYNLLDFHTSSHGFKYHPDADAPKLKSPSHTSLFNLSLVYQ